MITITNKLNLFLNMAKVQAGITRRLDAGLGGLGFSEFMILYHLSQAKDETMRRIDLAEKVGLTASGITRLLAPMEKIHLIKKEPSASDARESLVMLARGGQEKLQNALEDAEDYADQWTKNVSTKSFEGLSEAINEIGSKVK